MKRTAVIVSAACIIMVLTAGFASAKTLFVSDTREVSNDNSEFWVDAFNAVIKLTTYDNQCVELRFSTEAKTDGSALPPQIAFLAMIDDVFANPAPAIEEIDFDPSEFGVYDIASFSWYLCGLNIGTHTVQVMFSPSSTGNVATLRSGTLIIEMSAGKLLR